jgi:hypothetical protein
MRARVSVKCGWEHEYVADRYGRREQQRGFLLA